MNNFKLEDFDKTIEYEEYSRMIKDIILDNKLTEEEYIRSHEYYWLIYNEKNMQLFKKYFLKRFCCYAYSDYELHFQKGDSRSETCFVIDKIKFSCFDKIHLSFYVRTLDADHEFSSNLLDTKDLITASELLNVFHKFFKSRSMLD